MSSADVRRLRRRTASSFAFETIVSLLREELLLLLLLLVLHVRRGLVDVLLARTLLLAFLDLSDPTLQFLELASDVLDVRRDQLAVLFALGDQLLPEIEQLVELTANAAQFLLHLLKGRRRRMSELFVVPYRDTREIDHPFRIGEQAFQLLQANDDLLIDLDEALIIIF